MQPTSELWPEIQQTQVLSSVLVYVTDIGVLGVCLLAHDTLYSTPRGQHNAANVI